MTKHRSSGSYFNEMTLLTINNILFYSYAVVAKTVTTLPYPCSIQRRDFSQINMFSILINRSTGRSVVLPRYLLTAAFTNIF